MFDFAYPQLHKRRTHLRRNLTRLSSSRRKFTLQPERFHDRTCFEKRACNQPWRQRSRGGQFSTQTITQTPPRLHFARLARTVMPGKLPALHAFSLASHDPSQCSCAHSRLTANLLLRIEGLYLESVAVYATCHLPLCPFHREVMLSAPSKPVKLT